MAEMNKKTFGLAVIVSAVVSVGTYFGLSYLKPYKPEAAAVFETPTAEEVLGGTMNAGEPAATTFDPASELPATTAVAEAAPSETTEPVPVDESTPLPEASSEPAEAPVAEAAAESAPVEVAAAEPEPAPAPEPEPAAEPMPEPAPVDEPAPKPKAASKPKTKKPAASMKAEKAILPWWGTAGADELGVVYAGSAAYKKAVVLIFNGAFDNAEGLSQNVEVQNASGQKVEGTWELSANNKRMASFEVPGAGRYKVIVNAGLADRSSKALPRQLAGEVLIK